MKKLLSLLGGLYLSLAPSLNYAQHPLVIQNKQPENHYKVKKSETLKGVSKKTDISLDDLIACNPGLKEDTKLKPKQNIKLFETYKVKPGDTLGGIREKYGASLSDLLDYNEIKDPDKIYADSWLRLPCSRQVKPTSDHTTEGPEGNGHGAKKNEPKKAKYVTYPSGLKLEIVRDPKLNGEEKEFYDPNDSGNPLVKVSRKDLFKKVSPHFRLAEFAQVQIPELMKGYIHNVQGDTFYTYIRLSPDYVRALEKTRTATHQRIDHKSEYRSFGYNERLYIQKYGKRPTNSRHSSGDGGDIRISYKHNKKALERIFSNGGLGIDKNNEFVHVDTRGKKARWYYN